MMTSLALRLYTVEEFEQIADNAENADRLLELLHGEIVEKMPTEEHSLLAANIARLLGNYVIPLKLGRVGVEPRHRIPNDEHNARLPDVTFTSANRALPIVKKGSIPQLPDLAVEIQSPDDKPHKMREKALYYLQNGSTLVWLVYPGEQTIEVCCLNPEGTLRIVPVGIDDELGGADVLPDFKLKTREIFEVISGE